MLGSKPLTMVKMIMTTTMHLGHINLSFSGYVANTAQKCCSQMCVENIWQRVNKYAIYLKLASVR